MEDKSNLLPERAGQADVMTVACGSSLIEPEPDVGHWYSPAAVRMMLQDATAAERERCAKICKTLALEADGDTGFRDGCYECADGIRGLTDPTQQPPNGTNWRTL